ncbi:MAG: DNA repair protein RecN [Bacteroidales bacterium]
MITHITIENYALIKSLDLDFFSGFSVITGETGAGKSILLGALSLILGQRADTQVLYQKDKKCMVEVSFDIQTMDFHQFFIDNELDEEPLLLIRREISPTGKSRAFINDTPVSLALLKEIGSKLVDIHSQHESLTIQNSSFQLNLVDSFISTQTKEKYQNLYHTYKQLDSELIALKETEERMRKEQDYMRFLYDELQSLKLESSEQEQMETELEALNHLEQIKLNFFSAQQSLEEGEFSILVQLDTVIQNLKKIAPYYVSAKEMLDRIQASTIELKDVASELQKQNETLTINPQQQQTYTDRLDAIYRLENKHQVKTVNELLQIATELSAQLQQLDSSQARIEFLEKEKQQYHQQLLQLASQLREERREAAQNIEHEILASLAQLGMSSSSLQIQIQSQDHFSPQGMDKIIFLFNANLGGELKEIAKVASGGELSRLMLAIKSVIHRQSVLSTIIFDEIDTGVSGEIAGKVAEMMQTMAQHLQLLSISHLPQIAAKAQWHYRVCKKEIEGQTISEITLLNSQEHLKTIASMLSGKNTSQAAMNVAQELINE